MSEELIFFCQPNQTKLPARLQVNHFGNTGYLSISHHDSGLHVALAGNAAAMVLALRQAADDLEKRLFLSEHKRRVRRSELASNWDWLTPERVLEYFEQSPVLRAHLEDVKAALKHSTYTQPVSQLDQDMATIRPHLATIMLTGKPNKSEIARAIGITAGGSSNWARVSALAKELSSSSTPTARSEEEENNLRAAA